MKNQLLHDDFIDQARHYIQDITALRNSGNSVEAAKKNLEFAKFKVAYYEQFVDENAPVSNYTKIYDDEYAKALRGLGVARDECMDLGIYEK